MFSVNFLGSFVRSHSALLNKLDYRYLSSVNIVPRCFLPEYLMHRSGKTFVESVSRCNCQRGINRYFSLSTQRRFLCSQPVPSNTPINILSNCQRILPIYSRKMSSAAVPQVVVTPRVAMHDVKTKIGVEGLKPNEGVTLRMDHVDDKGRKFCSYAYYVSDKDGKVDVDKMSSIGGSYTGVFPSGLLMTLKPAPGVFEYARLTKGNMNKPMEIVLSINYGHHSCAAENKANLAETLLKRCFLLTGTQQIEVEYKRARGRLFVPPGPGPFPGVIDMYGGAGGIIQDRAGLLSSHGFVTYALPFFNYKDLRKDLAEMELEYFEDAVEYLTSRPNVIPDRCGVIGLCQGGGNAMMMALHLDKVKAAVLVNASPAPAFSRFTSGGQTVLQGIPLPHMARMMHEDSKGVVRPRPEWITEGRVRIASGQFQLIPLEKAPLDTHFYFAYGRDDAYQFYRMTDILVERLDAEGRQANYTYNKYEKAGHIIEAPYVALSEASYQAFWPKEDGSMTNGVIMAWDGSAEGNCAMQEDMWPKTIAFFEHHIKCQSSWYQDRLGYSADVKSKL